MTNLAEKFAEAYWKTHGLRAERFSREELGQGKTPDFRVYKAGELVAFCEAKHAQYDGWLDEKMDGAMPMEIVGGPRPDPIFNRLVGHIHKAYKQFMAVNPERQYPNVLVLMNSDMQSDCLDLWGVLTGKLLLADGQTAPIYSAYSEGRIKEEKFAIDLFVWLEESKGEEQRGRRFFMDGPHYASLCALLCSDSGEHQNR